MNKTSFQICFYSSNIKAELYPEATLVLGDSIVVEADNRYIMPKGKDIVQLRVDGQYRTYENVLAVCPYYYQEG